MNIKQKILDFYLQPGDNHLEVAGSNLITGE